MRRRPGLRVHRARQRPRAPAGLVLRHRRAEGPLPTARDVRSDGRVHRRLRGERARRLAGRDRELRLSAARAGRDRRDGHPRRRLVRPQRPQVLAVQRRRLGRPGRERGTPGVTYNLIQKIGHRLTPNAEIIFDNARIPAENLIEGTRGNGDLVINRNFAWSGPVAGIAAVGVARSAYEAALDWAKTYTAGGPKPIMYFQYPGYVLGDVAARIEMCRYFCWKTAHYLDQHDYHAEMLGAMCKIQCTELLFDTVYKCMQVVGVNSVDRQHPFEKLLREATILPLYDAGNFGMQRRRVHGVMSDPAFNPRAMMDDEPIEYTKAMEIMDTIPGPLDLPEAAPAR